MSTSVQCRSCGRPDLELVLSLGNTPLANSLISEEQVNQHESTYQLDLAFCPQCSLVQITETVPPEKLFREYLYFSSFSDTMLSHAREIVQRLLVSSDLSEKSLVVEIASNDGYLLQYYKEAGNPGLGIEPAVKGARVAAEERRVGTLTEVFNAEAPRELVKEGEKAYLVRAKKGVAPVA